MTKIQIAAIAKLIENTMPHRLTILDLGLSERQENILDAIADLIHPPPVFREDVWYTCPACGSMLHERLIPEEQRHPVRCRSSYHPHIEMTRLIDRVRVDYSW